MRRLAVALSAVALLAGGAGEAAAAWPERPVTLIVPWAAGGGTDATGRIVASLLEKELRQPVTVVNRTGGGGVVGHTEIANAEPDGYTLGVLTTELSMFHWIGTSPLTYEDYTLAGLYNTDPIGLHVRTDGPADAAALIAIIEAEPGAHKASGANLGGAAHLALAGLLDSLGLDPQAAPWVPSEGAAPSLQLLVSGAIDIVSTTLPEARGMIDAGEVKTLLVMADEPPAGSVDVPTAKEALEVDWQVGAWRGIGGPAGIPQDVMDRLAPALEKIVASDEFKEFMAGRGFGVRWAGPDEFESFLGTADANFGQAMKAAGIVAK